MKNLFGFCLLLSMAVAFPIQAETIDSLQTVLEQYEQKKDFSELIRTHILLGEAFKKQYEHDLALEHFHDALEIIQLQEIQQQEFEVLHQLGTLYFWKDDYDHSLSYLLRARKIGILSSTEKEQARNLSQIAQVYLHLGNHKQALIHQFQARDLSELANDSLGMAQAYNSLGIIYFQTHRYEPGEKYLLQALDIYRHLHHPLNLWSILATLASAKLEEDKLVAALSYCQEAKSLAEKNDIRYGIAFSTGTLGLIYLEKDQYDIAEHHLLASLKLLRELGVQAEAAEFSFGLAEIYRQSGQYQQSIDTLERVLNTAREIQSPRIAKEAFKELAASYEKSGNLERAHYYLQQHLLYRDSMDREVTIQQSLGAENQFEIQQRKIELTQAEERNRKNQNQVYIWILVGSWVLFGFATAFLWGRNQEMMERNQELNQDRLDQRAEISSLKQNQLGISEFIGLTTHHIQKPFQAIQDFIERNKVDQQDQKLQDDLDNIESWVAAMSVYAALGQSNESKQVVDLSKVVGEAIAELPSHLHKQTAQIRVLNLPIIQAHPQHIRLLFRHLLHDAFQQDGFQEPEILLQSQSEEGMVRIDIHSNNEKLANESNEVGFIICRAIIDHHGGSIWKTYDPTSGSKLTFTLPI